MAASTAGHPLKPDCSWSWTVAVACSAMNFFTAPMTYSAGVVYTYIMELYRVSRQDAAWPLSIVPFSLNIVAPLVGVTVKKIGIRPVAMAGAVVSSMSVSLCFFAPNVTYLSVFLGGLYGIGSGMLIIPNAVCVNTWFDRKRVSASGLVHAGTTLSAFVFPTLFRYCADAYGLRGGFLIFGAIMMNAAAFSLVVRSPPWTSMHGKNKSSQPLQQAPKLASASAVLLQAAASRWKHYSSSASVTKHTECGINNQAFDIGSEPSEFKPTNKRTLPIESIGTGSVKDYSTANLCCAEGPRTAPGCESRKYETVQEFLDVIKPSHPALVTVDCPDATSADKWGARPSLLRGNMLLPHSLDSTASDNFRYSNRAQYGESTDEQFGVGNAKKGECDISAFRTAPQDESSEVSGEQTGLCTTLFTLVCVTFVVVMNSIMMFMTVVMDFAGDRGIPLEKAVYLICGFAAADILGRLSCGWATDGNRVSHETIVGVCCLLLGVCFAVLPFLTTYLSIAAVIAMMGVAIGNCAALFTVVLSDAVGVKLIPTAMGIVGFCAGITALVRPYIIGYFRDQAGSYDDMLGAIGYVVIAVGITLLLYRVSKLSSERKSWAVRPCAD